jgi:hypothetical protein
MKNIITLISFTLICYVCLAQGNENKLSKVPLKGKIKEVIDHYFENIEKVDTLKPHQKEISRFDTTGNEIEEVFCDTDRVMVSIFRYNKNAENTEIVVYDTSKTDTMKSILKYNDKGYVIEKEDLVTSNTVLQIESGYKYNNMGQQVEIDLYYKNKPEDTTSKVYFKYDDKGNRVEKDVFLAKFGLFGTNIYRYDNQGHEIYSAWYNGAGRLSDEIKSEYSDFDSKGNWTMKTLIENVPGDPTKKTIVKRVIIYY